MLASADINGEEILVVVLIGFSHVRKTRRGDEWKPSGTMKVCLLNSILGAAVWCHVCDRILTLTPLWMR